MDDIFHELEEDLRRDNLIKLWKAYGRYLIAAVAAIIIGVAGYSAWKHYSYVEKSKASALFDKASGLIASKNYKDAIPTLGELAKTRGTYGAMAKILQAEAIIRQANIGKPFIQTFPSEAVELYEAVAQNTSLDSKLRTLAGLFAAIARIDTVNLKEVASLIEKLEKMKSGVSPWSGLATEMIALIHFKTGDYKKAREIYKDLAEDRAASTAQRMRAKVLSVGLDK